MEKLIRALRCGTSTPLNGFECDEDCPYRKLNEMGQDLLTYTTDVIIDGTTYYISCELFRGEVVAWMPLPEPYKEEEINEMHKRRWNS